MAQVRRLMASCWETEPTSRPEAGAMVTSLAGYISRWVSVARCWILHYCLLLLLVQGRPEEL